MENFEYDYEVFSTQERPNKYSILRSIRKSIDVSEEQAFKFFQRNDIIDNFTNILIKTNQSANKINNIEILRIFNRLSQVYSEFLNSSNINEFNNLIRRKISQDEDPLVRHYALICIGKVAHQSKQNAEKILELYDYVFDSINCEFDSNVYYHYLQYHFKELFASFLGETNAKYYQINTKKGDPYIYVIHGILKQLASDDRLKNIIIPKNINQDNNIIKIILNYLIDASRRNTNCIFTICNQVDILNDIVHANHHGTLKILKICEFQLDLFFDYILPLCHTSMFLDLHVSIMKLIGSFYKNGEKYTIFIEKLDLEFVSNMLFFFILMI